MLSRAYDVATNILQGSNNPQEVFQKAGIDRASFEKAKSLLNHPLAGWAIQKLGCNKDDLLKGINTAESVYDTEQAPASELDRLRENLKRIK